MNATRIPTTKAQLDYGRRINVWLREGRIALDFTIGTVGSDAAFCVMLDAMDDEDYNPLAIAAAVIAARGDEEGADLEEPYSVGHCITDARAALLRDELTLLFALVDEGTSEEQSRALMFNADDAGGIGSFITSGRVALDCGVGRVAFGFQLSPEEVRRLVEDLAAALAARGVH